MLVVVPLSAVAAPYAAMVVDARTGEVLHSRNADTRLHPASLTKMMTLYVAFEAVEKGEISLDTVVRISRNAAAEPPSKLGLKAGQRIKLRYLIRAAAVKSANDAATAIGEAIEGSEAAFARRMNRTAKALGMTRTTFKNMHGLTEQGHLSTARDMTTLGRHVLYDYPQYYNLFSRRSTHAGVREVANTNRRLLAAYKGADGIKTGYTRAAGFNLVASAERGNERIIATVFGGRSTAWRNARVAELLDMGFQRAPSRVALRKPEKPAYVGSTGGAGKTIRAMTAVKKSLRPVLRPGEEAEPAPVVVAIQDDIQKALEEAQANAVVAQGAATPPPPETLETVALGTTAPSASITPRLRPKAIANQAVADAEQPEVVTRVSTSGGHHWGINIGRYPSRHKAERVLLQTALLEMDTLDGSLRKVVKRNNGFDANFLGMTRELADLACRRLQARQVTCFMVGPPPS
ncbi:D-alanyl-D-alanine carboxypeptidase [Lutimaribacter sp. EGI FJ00015]|uniref:D-alanyl-D-alanine carboxypeptidase n=1 Tax=Lutimaribacter degradans TaxID=2945989 RepID=A0ACC5ZXG5_9RHOB|nr:D-alanyl-D-alanine carboxypeptidase family protein [Lutimaribacter sp. EGI FJ00013]MCM2562752.1 D-alanyl-D-alanine carboxypeptidase [Lutimaribacter sp. EGI FJ00013]MCO0613909.1 D-alanyl-D-alanine carboxypeptidase [Lutimaribacter sp. EGI FJ00015]MCO0636881.1 D-alanyl-D-alanine carboxypeptidase [Lutimaribacter sp. EGI FJ00014]